MDRRILIGGAVVVAVVIALGVFFSGKKVEIQTIPGQEVSAGQF